MTYPGGTGGRFRRALPAISHACAQHHHRDCHGIAAPFACACPCHQTAGQNPPPPGVQPAAGTSTALEVPATISETEAAGPMTAAPTTGALGRVVGASEPIPGRARPASPTLQREKARLPHTHGQPADTDRPQGAPPAGPRPHIHTIPNPLTVPSLPTAEPPDFAGWACRGACSTLTWPDGAWVCSAYNSELGALCTRHHNHPGLHIECAADRHNIRQWPRRAA